MRNCWLTVLFLMISIALFSCEDVDEVGEHSVNNEIENRAGQSSKCISAKEGGRVVLVCPTGETMDKIVFASYGTPDGSCSNGFRKGSCHSPNSQGKVERQCLNKQSCVVDATNGFFGDPCVGTYKRLKIEYTCTDGGGDDGSDDNGGDGGGGETDLPYNETFDDAGGSFQCSKDTCTWISPKLNTSHVSKLQITADARSYESGVFENADYLKMSYRIDGGSWVAFFDHTDDLGTKNVSRSVSNIGSNLQVKIEARTSAGNETYVVDNLVVNAEGDDSGDSGGGSGDNGDDSDPSNCRESDGCYRIQPTGSSDDSGIIQNALNKIDNLNGGTLHLKGNFVIARTLYLPSRLTWILDGKMSLSRNNDFDKVVVKYRGVTNTKNTAITEKRGGATYISMTGGTYDGNFVKNSADGRSVRFLNFANVTDSKFRNMVIENTSDDCFTLHAYSKHNEVRNLIARKSLANGLNDKGEYNKWYDSLAEDHESDGWTPKCSYSEFHRCVARRNKGPGFGLYARLDGDITTGAEIIGNKFYDCESYDNARAGMSFNIAEDRGPGAVIKDNFVQGRFYNNGMYGVSFRNKEPDGVVKNNEVDILAFGNKGITPKDGSKMDSGAGLRLDGEYISGVYGTVVSYNNSNLDLDLNHATNCNITVFNPSDQRPAELKTGSSTNRVIEKTFSCRDNLATWSTREYCGK